MTNEFYNEIYYEAEKTLLGEIEKEKSFFSLRTFMKLMTLNSIAQKLK